jgi:flavin reductase (DIM6/NTAB) family NADH-FMN oxidoreductase RutF
MAPDDFDTFVTQVDQSLVVVTASSDDQQAGCVVGFHTQCSIEPKRYAVWLSKANLTYRVSLFATHVGVHLLAEGDRSLLQLFGGTSGDRTEKFALSDWSPGPGGVPLLTACPTRAVLEITSRWDDGSDHACIVGTPILAEWTPTTPMRVSAANDTEGGHEATERSTPERLTAADQTATHPDPMDDSTRHELESAAAGAGHAIDLSGRDDEDPDH